MKIKIDRFCCFLLAILCFGCKEVANNATISKVDKEWLIRPVANYYYNPALFFPQLYSVAILSNDEISQHLKNIKEMTKQQHLDSIEKLKSKVKQLGRDYNLCIYGNKGAQQTLRTNNTKCTQEYLDKINKDLYLMLILYGIYILDEFLQSDKVCESMDTLFTQSQETYFLIRIMINFYDKEKYAKYDEAFHKLYAVFYTLSKKASDKVNEYERENGKCNINKANFPIIFMLE